MRSSLLLLLLACHPPDEGGKTSGDSAEPEEPGEQPWLSSAGSCPDVQMEEVAAWPEEVLPIEHNRSHTPAGVAVGDLDGDGWLDAIMAYGGGSVGFRNDGAGNLVLDLSIDNYGGGLPQATAVALADYDGDGDLDVFFSRDDDESDLILTNDGDAHFSSRELPNSGPAGATGAFADLDGDLDLDIFVGATTTDTSGDNVLTGEVTYGDGGRLYILEGDTYTEQTERIPAETLYGWTFQGAPMDFDNDGDMDIYVANDFGPYILPNKLLVNDGSGNFTEGVDCFCQVAMYSMGAGVGDANADGLIDVYITNVGGPVLLVNAGDGTFYDGTLALGASIPPSEQTMTSWGTGFLDINLDGWMDIGVTFGQLGVPELASEIEGAEEDWVDGLVQQNTLLMANREGQFSQADIGWLDPERPRALAYGDIDRDGKPDILSTGKYYLRHWRTTGGCDNSITVTLDGPPENTDGIGSRVELEFQGGRTVQWMLPSTTGSSSAHELYFGLERYNHAERITVQWPWGEEQVLEDIPAGETVTFTSER